MELAGLKITKSKLDEYSVLDDRRTYREIYTFVTKQGMDKKRYLAYLERLLINKKKIDTDTSYFWLCAGLYRETEEEVKTYQERRVRGCDDGMFAERALDISTDKGTEYFEGLLKGDKKIMRDYALLYTIFFALPPCKDKRIYNNNSDWDDVLDFVSEEVKESGFSCEFTQELRESLGNLYEKYKMTGDAFLLLEMAQLMTMGQMMIFEE